VRESIVREWRLSLELGQPFATAAAATASWHRRLTYQASTCDSWGAVVAGAANGEYHMPCRRESDRRHGGVPATGDAR
jgi:hypothetical protein